MGSSSSFVVGLFKALIALKGYMIGKHELAEMAIEFEQLVLKENVGSQDQFAVAYGGLNVIRFGKDGKIQVNPVTISIERLSELESHLMLIHTESKRLSSEIAKDFIGGFEAKANVLREMQQMVEEGVSILAGWDNINKFGILLNKAWELKRSISDSVSNIIVDRIYNMAMENGALGGKLLGAGSSGFMLLFAPPENQAQIKDALPTYLHVPFKFENVGSSIIYYEAK
jgi:D-glycero-alpha-D-manno-heptose-7-phosphate kinase